jgi:hypothetical protein
MSQVQNSETISSPNRNYLRKSASSPPATSTRRHMADPKAAGPQEMQIAGQA